MLLEYLQLSDDFAKLACKNIKEIDIWKDLTTVYWKKEKFERKTEFPIGYNDSIFEKCLVDGNIDLTIMDEYITEYFQALNDKINELNKPKLQEV